MHPPLNVHLILHAIQSTALASAMRGDSDAFQWLFPIIETCHVLSIAMVFGSIIIIDIRLLGIAERESTVSRLSREILPYTWAAFACAAVTGSMLFSSKAEKYFYNLHFELKFLFMLLAGVNMLVFHLGVYRRVLDWDNALPPPRGARIAGALSIALWIAVVFMGRWVGFSSN